MTGELLRYLILIGLVTVAAFSIGYHTGKDRARADELLRRSMRQRQRADQDITNIRSAIHGNDNERVDRKPG